MIIPVTSEEARQIADKKFGKDSFLGTYAEVKAELNRRAKLKREPEITDNDIICGCNACKLGFVWSNTHGHYVPNDIEYISKKETYGDDKGKYIWVIPTEPKESIRPIVKMTNEQAWKLAQNRYVEPVICVGGMIEIMSALDRLRLPRRLKIERLDDCYVCKRVNISGQPIYVLLEG
jgi:hypothetical protein